MMQAACSNSVWFLKASADGSELPQQPLYPPQHTEVVIDD